MKKLILSGCALALLALLLLPSTGCKTTTTVNPDGTTNVVKYIDPIKLQQAKDAIEPAASSVLRRAILRSPDHAVEISTYARAVGSVFRKMATTRQFSPVYLIDEANKATAGLQTTAPPEIIDAKNAAIALYKIFYGDQLMVAIPEDKWAMAISQLFWESIDQALKDAGQPGVN